MRKLLLLLEESVGVLIKVQMAAAIISMFFMILIIVHGVIMRYILHNPQAYSFEFAMYSLMPLTVFTLAYTQKLRGHVRVEVLLMFLPDRIKSILGLIADLLFLLYGIILLYAASLLTWGYFKEQITSENAQFPIWIVSAAMVIGLVGLCAQLIIDFTKSCMTQYQEG